MSTNPPSEQTELPCKEIIVAILLNAFEEIKELAAHPTSWQKSNWGKFKLNSELAELRWFITHPDGAELLATQVGMEGSLDGYREKGLAMLEKAESAANEYQSGGNPIVALISAPSPKVPKPPKRKEIQIAESVRGNPYSSVDIIAPEQPELFPDFFASTPVSL